jgi:hypothetical protein
MYTSTYLHIHPPVKKTGGRSELTIVIATSYPIVRSPFEAIFIALKMVSPTPCRRKNIGNNALA